MLFLNQLINGLHIGSIYALIALGYTMVYGIVKLINFAHGDIIMVGAYVSLLLITNSGLPYYLAIPITMVFCAVLGVVIERLAYKPLRSAPRISALITAIGISLALQITAQLVFGSSQLPFPSIIPKIKLEALTIGRKPVFLLEVLTFAVSIVLMVLLQLFVKRTRTGKAMRATAQDQTMAFLVGVNVDTVISITFITGSALAAIGGVLIASHIGQINFYIGFIAGIKAFTAAVLGGIGSIPGAVLGSFVLGLKESFATGYVSSAYEDVFAFSLLVLILIFRPAGLLGKATIEKV